MDPTLILAGILVIIIPLIIILGLVVLVMRRRRAAAEPAKSSQSKAKAKSQSKSKATAKPAQKGSRSNGNGPAPKTTPAQSSPPPAAAPAAEIQIETQGASGGKIRLLIVDDNPGTRENVSRLLYFEDDLDVIGQAINGREGVEMAADLKPHIVLMDINMPDMDGITATQEMSTKAPFSQVIIMSVQSDQHYMKRAMAAGARDFQPKPFTSEELVNCIRRVYQIGLPAYRQFEAMEQVQAQQESQPQVTEKKSDAAPVIAVYSPKGGVGTSAIAANLAVALHQAHGDVALMDGSLQFGDILVHLNTRPSRTIVDLVHDGTLEVDLLLDVLLAHDSGLKLLLAPPTPELADTIPAPMIKEVIGGLKSQFKAVIIDTDSQLTDTTLTVLEAADYILMVTVPELPAIKSAKLFLEVAEQLEYSTDQIIVAINRANEPGGVRLDKLEQVLKLSHTYRVPYDPKLHFTLNKGLSIFQEDGATPSAQAISALADGVWETIMDPEPIGEIA